MEGGRDFSHMKKKWHQCFLFFFFLLGRQGIKVTSWTSYYLSSPEKQNKKQKPPLGRCLTPPGYFRPWLSIASSIQLEKMGTLGSSVSCPLLFEFNKDLLWEIFFFSSWVTESVSRCLSWMGHTGLSWEAFRITAGVESSRCTLDKWVLGEVSEWPPQNHLMWCQGHQGRGLHPVSASG